MARVAAWPRPLVAGCLVRLSRLDCHEPLQGRAERAPIDTVDETHGKRSAGRPHTPTPKAARSSRHPAGHERRSAVTGTARARAASGSLWAASRRERRTKQPATKGRGQAATCAICGRLFSEISSTIRKPAGASSPKAARRVPSGPHACVGMRSAG